MRCLAGANCRVGVLSASTVEMFKARELRMMVDQRVTCELARSEASLDISQTSEMKSRLLSEESSVVWCYSVNSACLKLQRSAI